MVTERGLRAPSLRRPQREMHMRALFGALALIRGWSERNRRSSEVPVRQERIEHEPAAGFMDDEDRCVEPHDIEYALDDEVTDVVTCAIIPSARRAPDESDRSPRGVVKGDDEPGFRAMGAEAAIDRQDVSLRSRTRARHARLDPALRLG